MFKIKKHINANHPTIDFFGFDLSKYVDLLDILDSVQSKNKMVEPIESINQYIRVIHSEPIFRDVCFDFDTSKPFDTYDPIARFYVKPTFIDLDRDRQNKILSISIYKTLLNEYEVLYSKKELDIILHKQANTNKETFFSLLDSVYYWGKKKDNAKTNIKDVTKYLFK